MRAKQFLELYEAQQQLFEVEMSPSNLRKLAKGIEGAKVGIEFEMVVPNVSIENNDDDDDEVNFPEPEMNNLYEPARSIDDIVEFFDNPGYNDSRTITRLRNILETKYREWAKQFVDKQWDKNGKEYLLNWIRKNVSPNKIADYLDLPEDLLGDRIPSKEDYEEVAYEEWMRPGNAAGHNYYDAAYESFRDGDVLPNYYYDEDDEDSDPDENKEYIFGFDSDDADDADEETFLESLGINDMEDVYHNSLNSNHVLSWPSWTDPQPEYNSSSSSSSGGSESIQDTALGFMKALGYDSIAYSTSYHGTYYKWDGNDWEYYGNKKPNDCYAVEPDTSITKKSDEAGLEFVSPPLPPEQIMADIKNIKTWANRIGAYTNKSTAIHTNVSVPNYDIGKVDYVKLALLSGDKYVLDQFGRTFNDYTSSSLDFIKNRSSRLSNEQVEKLLDKLKNNVEEIASNEIHGPYSMKKMVSVNTGDPAGYNKKSGYVEFRAPGGDWLGTNYEKIENTILRYIVALDAAGNPEKYKREYTKALYKILKPKTATDNMSLFAQYMAGNITKEALVSKLKVKKKPSQTNDKIASTQSGEDETMYRFSTRDGSVAPAYASGSDPMEAFDRLTARNAVWRTMPISNVLTHVAEPSRRQTPPDVQQLSSPEPDSIPELTREYQQWCEQQGLPYVATEYQDFDELTDAQRDWIMRFNVRWSAAEEARDAPQQQSSSERRLYSVRNTDTGDVMQVFADSPLNAMIGARSENPDFRNASLHAAITAPEPDQTPRHTEGESLYRVTNNNTGEQITIAAGSLQTAYGRAQRNNPSWQGSILTARQIGSDEISPESPTYDVRDTAGTIHTLQIQANNADEARRIARLRYPELDSLPDTRLLATRRSS